MKKKLLVFIIIGGLILSSIAFYGKSFLGQGQKEQYEDEYSKEVSESIDSIDFEKENRVEEYVQSDGQGAVDIAVTLENMVEEYKEDELVFKIMLNTHSVNLDGIDYANLVELTTDKGVKIQEGFTWEIGQGGGHHLNGFLKIPKEYGGKDILKDSTESITLKITGLDGDQASEFTWSKEHLEKIK